MPAVKTLSGLLAATALLCLPAGAGAAVAGRDSLDGETIVYAADPGEANRLTVSHDGLARPCAQLRQPPDRARQDVHVERGVGRHWSPREE